MPEKDELMLVHKYVSGQMDGPEKQEFESRLTQEPGLASLTAGIAAIWDASLHYTGAEFSASKGLAGFNKTRGRRERMRWMVRIAALILLLITAGLLLVQVRGPSEDIYANSAITRHFEDGSVMDLRAGAHVRVPEIFGNNRREVEIASGDVFFDVARDTKRPFVVEHPWADVKVVGTSFMISIDTFDQTYLLIVTEGKVMFIPNMSRDEISVDAGNGLKFHAATRIIEPMRAYDTNTLSWQTGVLRFVNTPVEDVIADLIDHYEVEIALVGSQAGQCRFTAPLPYQKVPVTDILKALATTFDMTLITEEEGKHILKGGKCK